MQRLYRMILEMPEINSKGKGKSAPICAIFDVIWLWKLLTGQV